MKAVKFICSQCERKFNVDVEEPFVEKIVTCPICGAKFKLVLRTNLLRQPHNPLISSTISQFPDLVLVPDCD